jgi:hypothetical protein
MLVAESYRRLAMMDPPAMCALVEELSRLSIESSAAAAQQRTPEARVRADRDARRADAARAALDSPETEVSVERGT